ncbi:LysR family transcriptional regulator [Cupriavidus alkaliphilus]|uniref:LysR family transcriptional regulator n=1 Tax=Cupriavidus alkaliphilus TaxID=942866 RepID=UPI00311AB80F
MLYGRLIRQGRLRQLELLTLIADCGCIARAAKEACMSQSAATQALAQLELVLGMKLFERHARGIRPTACGQGFISHVREVMARLEQSAEFLASSRQGNTAVLRIGSIPAASYALAAPAISAFHQFHPDVSIELQEDRAVRLISLLNAGGLDVVFCRLPSLLPDSLYFEPVLHDEAMVIASSSHPLRNRAALPIQALQGARWVLPPSGAHLRGIFNSVVLRALPDAELLPLAAVSLPVLEAFLKLPGVVALIPRSLSGGVFASGRVCQLRVSMPVGLAPLGAVHVTDPVPELVQRLLAIARREVAACHQTIRRDKADYQSLREQSAWPAK